MPQFRRIAGQITVERRHRALQSPRHAGDNHACPLDHLRKLIPIVQQLPDRIRKLAGRADLSRRLTPQ
jgi:hypothetical protein